MDLDAAEAVATAEAVGGVAVGCNVNDPPSVRAAADETSSRLGEISGLVNAAGIFIVEGGVEECTIDDWDSRPGRQPARRLPGLQEPSPRHPSHAGSIINIASLYGFRGDRYEAAYDASKGAIGELDQADGTPVRGEGVRINAVAPGEILTPLTRAQFVPGIPEADQIADIARRVPMGRMGAPEEIAAVISFLISDDAVGMSGAILPVDGAFLAG